MNPFLTALYEASHLLIPCTVCSLARLGNGAWVLRQLHVVMIVAGCLPEDLKGLYKAVKGFEMRLKGFHNAFEKLSKRLAFQRPCKGNPLNQRFSSGFLKALKRLRALQKHVIDLQKVL